MRGHEGIKALKARASIVARRFVALLILLLVPASVSAEPLRFGQGLLWAVEKEGARASHVFGTFHSADPQILALQPPVIAAFEQASTVALELVLDDSMRLSLARAMILPPGRGLKDMVSPALFSDVAAAAAAYGLNATQVDRFKPWAMALLFSLPPEEQARQAAGQLALDTWLQREAQVRGKSVVGLETIEEQIAMFDELAPDAQRVFLEAAAADQKNASRTFEKTKQAYLRQDLNAIAALSLQDLSGVEAELRRVLEERIFLVRNRRMAARMIGLLDRGGAFVGVGALHLPGDQGVLAILEQRGYRIRRVD